jgi:tellurite resistance protein TerA
MAAPSPPAAGTVNLSKVTLEKKGQARSVDLRKGGGTQPLHINLNWSATVEGGARRSAVAVPDLDLGCMFEMLDGLKGVIQPLGNSFGNAHGPPWIWLDKDDRSGHDADGENLWVYRPDLLKRMMVFGLIYEGAPDFKSVAATLSVREADGTETVVHLDNPYANRVYCAILLVTNTGSSVEIRKEEQYFRTGSEADRQYRFGFRWSAGRKS